MNPTDRYAFVIEDAPIGCSRSFSIEIERDSLKVPRHAVRLHLPTVGLLSDLALELERTAEALRLQARILDLPKEGR